MLPTFVRRSLFALLLGGLTGPALGQQGSPLPTEWAQVDPAPGSTPYREINLDFTHDTLTLKGRLVLPPTTGRHPVVVLMGGSGSWSPYREYFRALADTFVPAGIGVFYYDKRNEGTDRAEKSSFDNLAGDALAAVEVLRGREDVDSLAVGLWGHSQGGWIAPLAASRSPHVRFVVTVGGPGVGPLEQTLYSQRNGDRRRGLSEDDVDAADRLRRTLALYYAHPTEPGWRAAQHALDEARRMPWFPRARFQELQGVGDSLASPARIRELERKYPDVFQLYTEQVPYDPVPALKGVAVPLLAIYGGADQVVPVDRSIAAFRDAFDTSGRRSLLTIHVFPGANHAVLMGSDGLNFAPGYLESLSTWVRDAAKGTMKHSRADAWDQDLSAFVHGIETLHHAPFAHVTRAEWEGRVAELRERIPLLSDDEIIVELMKLAALIGDGHTVVVPPFEGPHVFHRYPVAFYLFEDGLFIREAREDYVDLVGKRVVRLGDVPADSLMSRIARVFPHDNVIGLRWGLELTLPIAEVLHGLGIAPGSDHVRIVVEDEGGARRSRTLKDPEPLTGDGLQSAVFTGEHPNWRSMMDPTVPVPAWRRDLATPYRYEYLRGPKLVHVLFNQVRQGDVPFDEFLGDLFHFVGDHDVSAILLDLRTNEGGDLTMLRPLITGLIRNGFGAKGKLYVATGRRTFSAAGYLAARLDVYTDAIFVGEPPGTRPNFVGEASDPFRLPNSRVWVNASTLAWQGTFAFDHRPYIEPDMPVALTSEEYREGRDPVLEKVIESLGR